MIFWIILGLAALFVLFKITSNPSSKDTEKKETKNKEVFKEEEKDDSPE